MQFTTTILLCLVAILLVTATSVDAGRMHPSAIDVASEGCWSSTKDIVLTELVRLHRIFCGLLNNVVII